MFLTKGRGSPCRRTFDNIIAEWGASFGVSQARCVVWPVVPELALAMARGTWFGDVSMRFRRELPGGESAAPIGPSAMMWRRLLGTELGQPRPPPTPSTYRDDVVDIVREGARQRFHPAHIVATLRAGQHVSNKDKLREQLKVGLRWLFPRWSGSEAYRRLRDLPASNTHRQHVGRLDYAAMLARRAWYRQNGPTFRYLAFDASPQRGLEIFVTVERVVRQKDVLNAAIAV